MIYFMTVRESSGPGGDPLLSHACCFSSSLSSEPSIMLVSGLSECDWDTVDRCSALRLENSM